MYRRPPTGHDQKRLAWSIVAATLVIVVFLVLWNNVLRHYVRPKNFGTVEAGHVYRSGNLTPGMLRKVIRERGIRTIINLGGSDPGTAQHETESAIAQEMGVSRYHFRLTGETDDDPLLYAQALRLMADEGNHPLLVHCAAGSDRTTAAVILYEHLVRGGDIVEALDRSISQHRHNPGANPGLLAYLLEYIEEIRALYLEGLDAETTVEQSED